LVGSVLLTVLLVITSGGGGDSRGAAAAAAADLREIVVQGDTSNRSKYNCLMAEGISPKMSAKVRGTRRV